MEEKEDFKKKKGAYIELRNGLQKYLDAKSINGMKAISSDRLEATIIIDTLRGRDEREEFITDLKSNKCLYEGSFMNKALNGVFNFDRIDQIASSE